MTTFIKELCELLSCHCFIPKLLIPPIHPDFFLIETLIFFSGKIPIFLSLTYTCVYDM